MATPSDRTRRRQAPTQQATPIVGPRSQGPSKFTSEKVADPLNVSMLGEDQLMERFGRRPSPYSGLRAAIAGSARRRPRVFRDQPLPQQATGGRFGSIDETMPQPSPRFRQDLFPQTTRDPWEVHGERYGMDFGSPEYWDVEHRRPGAADYQRQWSEHLFNPKSGYPWRKWGDVPQTRVRTPAPPVARDNQRNRFGAPAEDPGLYNLYQMMMGRRRRQIPPAASRWQ